MIRPPILPWLQSGESMTRIRAAICAAATLLCALSAFSQNAPLPQPPFPSPITSFTGRFVDSTSTPDFQFPNRTLRAYWVKIAPELDRIFVVLGAGTFASYKLSTFASRLSEPLATGPHGEKFLPPEMRVDPERPGSGWTIVLLDGQERLFDFDWDERG